MAGLSLLHLTDIHAGQGELVDEDGKTPVPKAQRLKQLDRLTKYLSDLPTPDYVVVSGDITIRGDRGGLETFRDWLANGIRLGFLPAAERILLVPGNHDVTRRRRQSDDEKVQFRDFWQVFGKAFPHAHIPEHDPVASIPDDASLNAGGLVGGIKTTEGLGEFTLSSTQPFLLDLDRDLLIFGFNSAHGCGVPLPPDTRILESISSVSGVILDLGSKNTLEKARELYLDSLIIDAGLITDLQLVYFNKVMSRLQKILGPRYNRLTKIAVLHHHIGHLWGQQIELKQFEATLDAAQLKQALTEHTFDMVLHGHKHTNHVGLDGSIIPIDRNERFSPLCIISGGTIAGYPRMNDTQSFKIIELMGASGPRTRAEIREVPLRESANPASVIKKDSRIFHVPLSSRLPELHDLTPVKMSLDHDLANRLAPELATVGGTHALHVSLQAHDENIFASSLRYRCHSSLEYAGRKIFYEIIQATKKLSFGAIARIHWLVTDAVAMATDSVPTAVVILIGDLERTHYSQSDQDGEIERSIQTLKTGLAPALESKIIDIRTYCYSQDEMSKLSIEISK